MSSVTIVLAFLHSLRTRMRRRTGTTPILSPQAAVAFIESNDRVFVHSVAMAPPMLIEALCAREDLAGVELIHIHTEGSAPYVSPELSVRFHHNACFVGSNVREAVASGRADYIPVFLSEMPRLFRERILPIDVALISVSPPDAHGYCSLGPSVDISTAAIETARIVIAEVNENVPRTHGDGHLHWDEIDCAIIGNRPLPTAGPAALTDVERAIGRHVAGLVEDGATLQMGIGAIPNAVLKELGHHRRLGIHTEMFSDGLIPLVESGVVTGEEKAVMPHKIVATFALGSERLYRFIDDNPMVIFKEAAFTNDSAIIRQNPKVTAINSALEIDLTGQVCADSIGPFQYSGVGGQMDFIRGASLSPGGKPIIAMPSTTRSGRSKICTYLQPGASVTTTRAHVHYVVTEYGAANLFGRNLRERAKLLIDIAHPDHREALERGGRN